MKFLLTFLATVAVATAAVIHRKNVDLMDDGTVIIRGENGNILKIQNEDRASGRCKIEIQVTGPNTATKKIEIDENNHVFVKEGEHYRIPLTLDKSITFDAERNRRTAFERQNEELDSAFLKEMSPSATMLDKQRKDANLIDDLTRLMDPMMRHTIRQDLERMTWPNINTNFDMQRLNTIMTKIVMRLLKQNVLMHILDLYGMEQTRNEMILDKILRTRGIFDKKALMELLQDPFLRNMMLKHRIFDESAVHVVSNQQVSLNDLEHIVNRQVLKNWMISFGCRNKDKLRRLLHETIVENLMANENLDHLWLLQVIDDSTLRQFLVQKRIFNEDILEKCLRNLRTHLRTGDDLIRQLINRGVLRMHLVNQGFHDIAILNRLTRNEILGLKVLLNLLTLSQTSQPTYRPIMEAIFNKPDWRSDRVSPDNIIPFDSIRNPVTTKNGFWDLFSKHEHNEQNMIDNMNDLERRRMLPNQMAMFQDEMM